MSTTNMFNMSGFELTPDPNRQSQISDNQSRIEAEQTESLYETLGKQLTALETIQKSDQWLSMADTLKNPVLGYTQDLEEQKSQYSRRHSTEPLTAEEKAMKQWSSSSTQATATAVANTIKAVCDAHTDIETALKAPALNLYVESTEKSHEASKAWEKKMPVTQATSTTGSTK